MYSDEPELITDVTVTLMALEVEVAWMDVEVDAVVPVVVDKAVVEVLETLEGVLDELMTLEEVPLVEGELTPGIVLVELETAGREVMLVVLDKTDNDEVILDAIGIEEFKTKELVKELAELVGGTKIELLLPKVEEATIDEVLDEDDTTKLEGPMLWLVTTLVGNGSELDELMNIERGETVV